MATDRVRGISLAALQQRDPYVSGIVDVASQVALYSYNTASNEWEKTEVEGTLFVYARSASPHNGFTIMNRLSMDNLIQPITKDLDFKLQDPFLLYRIADLSIHGIWFYDKNDCLRIANLMTELAQKSSGKSTESREACTEKSVNILEMLNRAREVYQQTRPGQETNAAGAPGTTEILAVAPMTSLTHQQVANPPEDTCNRRLSVAALLGTCAQTDGACNAAPCDSVSQGTKSSCKLGVARALSYEQAASSQHTAAGERHGFQQVAPQTHLPSVHEPPPPPHPEGRCQLPAQVHQCLPYVVECSKDRGENEQLLQKLHGNRIPAKQGAAIPIVQSCPDFGSPVPARQMPPGTADSGAATGQVWHNVRLPHAPAMQPGSCFVPQAGGPEFQGAPHLRSALQPGDLHLALKSGQTPGTMPQGNGFQPVAGLVQSNTEPPLFDLLQKLQIVKPEPQHQHQQQQHQHQQQQHQHQQQQHQQQQHQQQQHQQQPGHTSCSETQQGSIVTLLSQEDLKKLPKSDRENLTLPFPHMTGTMAAGVLLSPQTFQQSSVKLSAPNAPIAQSMPPQMANVTSHGVVSRSHLQETLIHLLKNDNEFLNIIYEAYLESSRKASLNL